MTKEQQALHNLAISQGRGHIKLESDIIGTIQEIDKTRLYKVAGFKNIFEYMVKIYGFTESVAGTFKTVAKKASQIPQLNKALINKQLSVNKASRFVSALNTENADHLVSFAIKNTVKALELEVATINPRATSRDSIKPISENLYRMTVTMTKKAVERLERIESLEAQRGNMGKKGDAINAAFEVYLDYRDPVRKAERAAHKKTPKKSPHVQKKPSDGREKPKAHQKHAVNIHDQGRCTHIDQFGERCNSDRWVELHHKIRVCDGGSNDPENLTTLCSYHHDLIHQMSFPLEGEPSAGIESIRSGSTIESTETQFL